jgi:hypothetical protein
MALPKSKYFAEIHAQLLRYKMMEPAKLAVTTEAKLVDLIRLAANEEMPTEDFMEILEWLEEEWQKAKVIHGLLGPMQLEEWALERYKFNQERERMAKEGRFALAQSEYSERKRAKIDPLCTGLASAYKGRVGDLSRTNRDEAERDRWALKALDILMHTGWLSEDVAPDGEAYKRVLTRLKKGLRMRTIKQRVHSLMRIKTWSGIALRSGWVQTSEEFETFLIDLAEGKGTGVSSFLRGTAVVVKQPEGEEASPPAPLPNPMQLGRIGDGRRSSNLYSGVCLAETCNDVGCPQRRGQHMDRSKHDELQRAVGVTTKATPDQIHRSSKEDQN